MKGLSRKPFQFGLLSVFFVITVSGVLVALARSPDVRASVPIICALVSCLAAPLGLIALVVWLSLRGT
jgi:hypothetical protein